MKQKDIGLIVAVVIFSGVFSLVLSKFLFNSPQKNQTEVAKVLPITADFPAPDGHYFNANSVDPTQLIRIGDDRPNQQPFDN